jgi:hypothetical protein
VKRWNNSGWEQIGTGTFRVHGTALELSLPRDIIGEASGFPAFDFHWADNIQSFDGIHELGVNGDSAPNRRWNYRFQVTP